MTDDTKIVLTLDPTVEEAPAAPQRDPAADAASAAVIMDESVLSPAEKKAVEDFARQINIHDSNMILQYGSAAQKKMADFSGTALDNVRTKDLGEVGGMLTELIGELNGFDIETESKGLFGRLKKVPSRIGQMKIKYEKAEVNVDKIVGVLEGHQVTLFKDIAVLDRLYERNLVNFKELTMYIIAGKRRLDEVRATELVALQEKARLTGKPEDAQAASDFANLCDRFEKKIHDLELTRMVSIQMAPQIRLVQNNDTIMAEKIQSTVVNTIPLWKSQMVIALGLAHSQDALRAQREVTDATNALLRKNADALKLGTVETAREAERGIIDIETLKYTNEQLIATLTEVMQIQDDGRTKRREAEAELGRIEGELKQKLLDMSSPRA